MQYARGFLRLPKRRSAGEGSMGAGGGLLFPPTVEAVDGVVWHAGDRSDGIRAAPVRGGIATPGRDTLDERHVRHAPAAAGM